jgi:hypothetical protein
VLKKIGQKEVVIAINFSLKMFFGKTRAKRAQELLEGSGLP